jgi:hypothetical protein
VKIGFFVYSRQRGRRALRKHGPDFAGEIESPIDPVDEFPACLDGLYALPPGEGR